MNETPETLREHGRRDTWLPSVWEVVEAHVAAWEVDRADRDALRGASLAYDDAMKTAALHWLNCQNCKAEIDCPEHDKLVSVETLACQTWRRVLGVAPFASLPPEETP